MELPLPPSEPDEIRRVAFLGTPEIAVPTLRSLHAAGYEIPLVLSGADKRRGRGKTTSATAVKAVAIELGLNVATDVDDLLALHEDEPIDLAIVVAFGQLIRPHVLAEIPMINIHFSALPRWRGAAPVERAILAGDDETAISIMTVAEGLDEGDVWAMKHVPIGEDDTLTDMWSSMSDAGADLLIEMLQSGFVDPQPQVGEVTYARKLTSTDGELDFSRPATELDRVVRVGLAWTTHDGARFKIHEASIVSSDLAPGEIRDGVVGTSAEGLKIEVVQPAGKPRMSADAWANGAQPDGTCFGD
jgi:methionyl-tRNA formyltransferase